MLHHGLLAGVLHSVACMNAALVTGFIAALRCVQLMPCACEGTILVGCSDQGLCMYATQAVSLLLHVIWPAFIELGLGPLEETASGAAEAAAATQSGAVPGAQGAAGVADTQQGQPRGKKAAGSAARSMQKEGDAEVVLAAIKHLVADGGGAQRNSLLRLLAVPQVQALIVQHIST